MKKFILTVVVLALSTSMLSAQKAQKPIIPVIWGDDIGQFNVGAYNMGIMGPSVRIENRLF